MKLYINKDYWQCQLTRSYITSTKNSQGLPMAMRKDCRLAERSLSGWGGGWGEVVAVATDDPLDRDPPLRLCGFLFLCGMSTPLSLAELPPLLATAFGWTQIREWSDPLLLPKKETNNVNTRKTKFGLVEFDVLNYRVPSGTIRT